METAITSISSRGQIVIPLNMRQDMIEGEKLLIIKEEGSFVMKKLDKIDPDTILTKEEKRLLRESHKEEGITEAELRKELGMDAI